MNPTDLQEIPAEMEQSPFRKYEERYCNRCEDYPGCIGLVDSMAVKMQDMKNEKMTGLPPELAQFLRHMTESSGMGSSRRFSLIATCMGVRHHWENHIAKPRAKKQAKKKRAEA